MPVKADKNLHLTALEVQLFLGMFFIEFCTVFGDQELRNEDFWRVAALCMTNKTFSGETLVNKRNRTKNRGLLVF